MARIQLENCVCQVFKDMNLSAPSGAYVFDAETHEAIEIKERTKFYTLGNNRMGIGRYKINMLDPNGRKVYCMNYMMDDNLSKHHAIWRMEDEPYTPEMIYKKYGYHVTVDHKRAKQYKLTGRVRTLKIAKQLKEMGRHEDADRIVKEMKETVSKGKRYIIHKKDIFN
jgi:hypothetical protein